MHSMCTHCTVVMHLLILRCTLTMHILCAPCTFGEKKSPAHLAGLSLSINGYAVHSRLNSLMVVSGPLLPDCFCTSDPTKEFLETLTENNRSPNVVTAFSFITLQATYMSGSIISRIVFPVLITESTSITFFVSGLTNSSCFGS